MTRIKHFLHRCRLTFLRLRLRYACSVIYRTSCYHRAVYHRAMTRACYRLSLWESQYCNLVAQTIADKKEAAVHEHSA